MDLFSHVSMRLRVCVGCGVGGVLCVCAGCVACVCGGGGERNDRNDQITQEIKKNDTDRKRDALNANLGA